LKKWNIFSKSETAAAQRRKIIAHGDNRGLRQEKTTSPGRGDRKIRHEDPPVLSPRPGLVKDSPFFPQLKLWATICRASGTIKFAFIFVVNQINPAAKH